MSQVPKGLTICTPFGIASVGIYSTDSVWELKLVFHNYPPVATLKIWNPAYASQINPTKPNERIKQCSYKIVSHWILTHLCSNGAGWTYQWQWLRAIYFFDIFHNCPARPCWRHVIGCLTPHSLRNPCWKSCSSAPFCCIFFVYLIKGQQIHVSVQTLREILQCFKNWSMLVRFDLKYHHFLIRLPPATKCNIFL